MLKLDSTAQQIVLLVRRHHLKHPQRHSPVGPYQCLFADQLQLHKALGLPSPVLLYFVMAVEAVAV